ncbi:unnamed protein product, partial [Laminaria digitata]
MGSTSSTTPASNKPTQAGKKGLSLRHHDEGAGNWKMSTSMMTSFGLLQPDGTTASESIPVTIDVVSAGSEPGLDSTSDEGADDGNSAGPSLEMESSR